MPSMSSAPSLSTRKTSRVPLFTADAWAPLKVELFRSLWIATSIAQIGTWAREAAGPSLMNTLTEHSRIQPEMVARVLVFSNLPICLFSVFAGALADVLDRRKLLIVTQIWMVIVSTVLGLLTIAHLITPGTLLFLTFLLGVGTAAFGPALQAVLPELVPIKQFALAINLNSVALNVARAVGPALFIVIVYFVPGQKGAGFAFLLTAVSFLAAIVVLVRWKREPQRAAVHGEGMWSGISAGFRYTTHSPANRAILLRVLTFIVPAVVLWSQVPIIVTKQLGLGDHIDASVQQYTALLFTFVGGGAIFGVLLMPGLHARYKIDPVVNVCTAFFGIGLILLSFTHTLWLAAIILIFLGVNWVIIPTNFNTATQKSVPLWVKGRAISFYLTVLFGSFAIGGAIWGRVTTAHSIHVSLLAGGVSMLALLTLAIWFPLTLNEGRDLTLSPSEPITASEIVGPVQLVMRYQVPAQRVSGFEGLLHDLRRTRLRNGAKMWALEHGVEADRQIQISERVTFKSWSHYQRYHNRTTQWDRMLEGLAREYHLSTEGPMVAAAMPIIQRGSATAQPIPAIPETWMQRQVARSLDRLLDELFISYDRLTGRNRRRVTERR